MCVCVCVYSINTYMQTCVHLNPARDGDTLSRGSTFSISTWLVSTLAERAMASWWPGHQKQQNIRQSKSRHARVISGRGTVAWALLAPQTLYCSLLLAVNSSSAMGIETASFTSASSGCCCGAPCTGVAADSVVPPELEGDGAGGVCRGQQAETSGQRTIRSHAGASPSRKPVARTCAKRSAEANKGTQSRADRG